MMKNILFLLFALCSYSFVSASDSNEVAAPMVQHGEQFTDANRISFQIQNIWSPQTLYQYDIFCLNLSGKEANIYFRTEVYGSEDRQDEVFTWIEKIKSPGSFTWPALRTTGLSISEPGSRITLSWRYTLEGNATVYTGEIEYRFR